MVTIFVTGTGNRRRKNLLRPIYLVLRDLNTQSLPGLHSFPGADITGIVACQGNLSFWKAFKDCDIGTYRSFFSDLGKQAVLEDPSVRQLQHYVCLLYQPETTLSYCQ